ncbi:MAG: hypothetical protein LBO20_04580 [Bifidobacteriaceae bacterium]|jgi:hypothetical protein|nr:hypothetical protein [Bifidobacteriaceae bacterium]
MLAWRVAACLTLLACLAGGCHTPTGTGETLSDEPYRYPLTPDSDPVEWAKHDPAELAQLVRVPSETLEAMSTKAVAMTVLTCPLLVNYLVYSSLEQGLAAVERDCNALPELLSRADAAEVVSAVLRDLEQVDPNAEMEPTFIQIEFLRGLATSQALDR